MSDPTRRKILRALLFGFAAGAISGAGGYRLWSMLRGRKRVLGNLLEEVVPAEGIETNLFFGDVLQKIIAADVLVPDKLKGYYTKKGGMPPWVAALLAGPSDAPIRFTAESASHLLSLLWPIGLATRTSFNESSPTNGEYLPRLASTAGWKLGHAPNGAMYFNRVDAMTLTLEQSQTVRDVAARTFRPCCNNPALFQDCNHGSAMLGLLELGASQGLEKAELERVALTANTFWFPREYLKTAIYFSLFENRSWRELPPAELLDARYSSASGWQQNVNIVVQMTNLIPRQSLIRMNSAMCGL